MTIRLTEEQWAGVMQANEVPVRVSDPAQATTFVLVRADVYERFKALFEGDPVTEQERLFQLKEFAMRAGWDDPAMDAYEDLDPRRKA
jgi:DNA-binding SARP family transcriptional activator